MQRPQRGPNRHATQGSASGLTAVVGPEGQPRVISKHGVGQGGTVRSEDGYLPGFSGVEFGCKKPHPPLGARKLPPLEGFLTLAASVLTAVTCACAASEAPGEARLLATPAF